MRGAGDALDGVHRLGPDQYRKRGRMELLARDGCGLCCNKLRLKLALKKIRVEKEAVTVWQELLHWAGLMLAICLISYVVHIGLQNRFEASIEVLILLALTTYLAGVYIEVSFIPIGILLGGFAAGIAFFDEYLYESYPSNTARRRCLSMGFSSLKEGLI